jgi:hypothetical protein
MPLRVCPFSAVGEEAGRTSLPNNSNNLNNRKKRKKTSE